MISNSLNNSHYYLRLIYSFVNPDFAIKIESREDKKAGMADGTAG